VPGETKIDSYRTKLGHGRVQVMISDGHL